MHTTDATINISLDCANASGIVHDWLVGMRGGEKCLEVFCELYPDADLYTLIYAAGKVSPTIRRMKVHVSWLNHLPMIETYYRYLLWLFPKAVETFDLADYDLILSSSHCVAKGIFPHRALHLSYVHARCAISGISTATTLAGMLPL